jgi:GntR family transcriptional regulator/MocR family aminotransferase
MAQEQTNQTPAADPLGVDLLLDIHRDRLREGLVAELREAVRSGRLTPGTKLPASRTLAADIGVSRSTVTECYSTLVAEGWLTARQGSGTRVASPVRPRPAKGTRRSTPRSAPPNLGLVPGTPEFADFPRQPWLAAARRALTTAPVSAFGYGPPEGVYELRAMLSEYLGRVRGVRARPEQVMICAGFHEGLRLVASVLRKRGAGVIAVESYGLDLYRDLLTGIGIRTPAIQVDNQGADTSALVDLTADAVLLTPAHQFPTGVALSSERRAAARDWARISGGYILEDDYDGEFRYDRTPVGALQGLDPDRVVYFGTASKSLAPGLRIAWIVVPTELVDDVRAERGPVDVVSAIDQLTFAEFIRSGAFDRHIRGRRLALRRRQAELVAALVRHAPEVRVSGLAAGLQAVIEVPATAEPVIVAEAARRGLKLSTIAEFQHSHPDAVASLKDCGGLVVNYASTSDNAWEGALTLLSDIIAVALHGRDR